MRCESLWPPPGLSGHSGNMEALVSRLGALTVSRPAAPAARNVKQGVALSQRAVFAATPVSLSSGRQAVPLAAQRARVARAVVAEVRALTAPLEHRRTSVSRRVYLLRDKIQSAVLLYGGRKQNRRALWSLDSCHICATSCETRVLSVAAASSAALTLSSRV